MIIEKSTRTVKIKARKYDAKRNSAGVPISINIDRLARPGRILAKVTGQKPLKGKGKYVAYGIVRA